VHKITETVLFAHRVCLIFRFIEVEEIHEPRLIFAVGTLGLLVNIVGLFLFHGE
jgi:zinc transporter 1